MNSAAQVLEPEIDPLTPVAGPADFQKICDDGADGVIWRRRLPAGFQDWIEALPVKALPSARIVCSTPRIDRVVSEVVEASGMPHCDHRRWFVEDVTAMAAAFAESLTAPHVRLRFDVVSDDNCRKFHRDSVTARLLCTYRGAGTHYGLVHNGDTPDWTFSAPTGAPVVLRGTLWPGDNGDSFRHRSPPIESSNTTRLLLAVDPMTAPTDSDIYATSAAL
ncbi:MAG: DUF1826 domain-containing protein [Pseudomonadota bacterium]